MSRALTVSLRIFIIIGLLLVAAVCWSGWTAVFILADYDPDLNRPALWVGLGLATVVAVCLAVILVGIWLLVGLVDRQVIFSPRAYGFVNLIIGAALVGAAACCGGVACVVSLDNGHFPRPAIELAVATLAALALATLVVVMKNLLRQAVAARTELDMVV